MRHEEGFFEILKEVFRPPSEPVETASVVTAPPLSQGKEEVAPAEFHSDLEERYLHSTLEEEELPSSPINKKELRARELLLGYEVFSLPRSLRPFSR